MRKAIERVRRPLRLRRKHSSSGCVDFPDGGVRRSGEPDADAACDKMERAWDRLRGMTWKDGQNIGSHLRWMKLIVEDRKPPEIHLQESYFGSSLLFFDEDGGATGVYLYAHEGQNLREPPWELHGDLRVWPWFSFEGSAPGGEQDSRAGWIDDRPDFAWSYVQEDDGQARIEITWSLHGVPADWQDRVIQAVRDSVRCQVEGAGECILHADRSTGDLRFRGSLPLPATDLRPLERKVVLPSEPLAIREVDGHPPYRERVALRPSVPILRWTASVDGRATRFIAEDELDKPFETTIVTLPRILLPRGIPARSAKGWRWDLKVEDGGPREEGGREVRLWRITAASSGQGLPAGTWQEAPWINRKLSWFLDGDGGEEATLWQTAARNARLGWEIAEIDSSGSALCLVRSLWRTPDLPVSGGSLNGEENSGLLDQVTVEIGGLPEVFRIDGASELPEQSLVLDPEQWVAFTASGERIPDPEVLGHVGGAVWWRLPASDGNSRRPSRSADWGAGSSPVLVMQRGETLRSWGGLWVTEGLPRDIEEIVPVLPEAQDRLVVTPDEEAASLWVSFRGFIDRYDRRDIQLPAGGSAVAWVGHVGLPLFPQGRDHFPASLPKAPGAPDEVPRPAPPASLLRSMSPLFARIETHARETVALEVPASARASRPLLRLGELLLQAAPPPRILVPETTLLRLAVGTDLPQDGWLQAPSGFHLALPRRVPGEAFWMSVEPHDLPEPRPRILLCWDDRGWRFRGFYVLSQVETCLGRVGLPGGAEVPLVFQDTAASRRGGFSLQIIPQSGGALRFVWEEAPAVIRSEVSDASLAAWYANGLRPGDAPGPLRELEMHAPVVQPDATLIRFSPVRLRRVEHPEALGIRIWWSPSAPRIHEPVTKSGDTREPRLEKIPLSPEMEQELDKMDARTKVD